MLAQKSRWLLAGCLVGGLMIPLSLPAHADGEDALDAVARIAPEVFEEVAPLNDTQVTDGELLVSTDSAEARVPLNSGDQIRITDSGKELKITLPFDEKRVGGQREPGEPVQFDNGNGTSTIPVVKDDGSVQITTVIENAASPQSFRYDLELPPGFSMRPDISGSVAFVDSQGNVAGGVAAPWARDSKGQSVPTTYEVSGSALTQVVQHQDNQDITYPVVADPWLGIPLISQVWVTGNTSSWIVNVVPTSWGRQYNAVYTHFAHVDELRTRLNNNGTGWALNYTIEQQFLCHVQGTLAEPGTYNLESWRVGMAWATQLNTLFQCNPPRV